MTVVLLVAAALAGAWSVLRARRGSTASRGGLSRLDQLPLPQLLVARVTPDDAARRLARAGVDSASPQSLGRARILGAAIAGLAGLAIALVWPPLLALAPVLGVLGFAAPAIALGRAEAERGRAIRAALPGALDLLAICVRGGMALDPALRAVARHARGPIACELERLLESIAMGTLRRTAYQELAERCPCPEVAALVAALRQSEELGAPLAPALSAQAREVRDSRRRAALERASTAAPRIQLVTALVLVPAAMLLIVATLLVQLGEQIGAVIGQPA